MPDTRIETLLEWMKSDKNDPFIPYALALEYIRSGNEPEAVRLLRQVVTEFPDYLPAYYQLGQTLHKLNTVTESLQVLQAGQRIAETANDMKTAAEIRELIAVISEQD